MKKQVYNFLKLKELRDKKNETIADLVVATHNLGATFVHSTYWSWEKGFTEPTASELGFLASYYGVNITEFYK